MVVAAGRGRRVGRGSSSCRARAGRSRARPQARTNVAAAPAIDRAPDQADPPGPLAKSRHRDPAHRPRGSCRHRLRDARCGRGSRPRRRCRRRGRASRRRASHSAAAIGPGEDRRLGAHLRLLGGRRQRGRLDDAAEAGPAGGRVDQVVAGRSRRRCASDACRCRWLRHRRRLTASVADRARRRRGRRRRSGARPRRCRRSRMSPAHSTARVGAPPSIAAARSAAQPLATPPLSISSPGGRVTVPAAASTAIAPPAGSADRARPACRAEPRLRGRRRVARIAVGERRRRSRPSRRAGRIVGVDEAVARSAARRAAPQEVEHQRADRDRLARVGVEPRELALGQEAGQPAVAVEQEAARPRSHAAARAAESVRATVQRAPKQSRLSTCSSCMAVEARFGASSRFVSRGESPLIGSAQDPPLGLVRARDHRRRRRRVRRRDHQRRDRLGHADHFPGPARDRLSAGRRERLQQHRARPRRRQLRLGLPARARGQPAAAAAVRAGDRVAERSSARSCCSPCRRRRSRRSSRC